MIDNKVIIEIEDYQQDHQTWFESLNRAWIEKYFWMESIDVQVLQHPDQHILKTGGKILMARYANEIAGTVALKFSEPGVYEFTKMAVEERYRGLSIGRTLSEAAIQKAKDLGAHKIILYSHTSLQPAIILYRKLGFREVPVDGPYQRSDIKMELRLDGTTQAFDLRVANQNDLEALRTISVETFQDTFGPHNTAEDMQLYIEKNLSVERIQQELNTSGSVFFLAFDGSRLAGYAKVRDGNTRSKLTSFNALEIERIYVTKEYLGKQLGKELLQACIQYGRRNKYEMVWLGVWEHNLRALAFYRKSGFEKFSEHTFVLGTDHQTDWLMKKAI